MLVEKGLSSKKKVIYALIIVINFLVVGYILYINFSKKPAVQPSLTGAGEEIFYEELTGEGTISPPALEEPREALAGTPISLFADPLFKQLKIYGDLPVRIGKVGRESPFDLFEVEVGVVPSLQEREFIGGYEVIE